MPHLLIIEARFYTEIADALVSGAVTTLVDAGAEFDRVAVPGALEIPGVIKLAEQAKAVSPKAKPYDGYVALGCVIRGETSHYDYVCGESARGLQDLAVRDGVCVGNGILTTENREQAWVRADPAQKNKGRDAAEAALAMIALKQAFLVGDVS